MITGIPSLTLTLKVCINTASNSSIGVSSLTTHLPTSHLQLTTLPAKRHLV